MPLVPMVIQSDGRAERSFDIYSRLLDERIIFLGTAIDAEVANLITAQLLHLAASDPDRDMLRPVDPTLPNPLGGPPPAPGSAPSTSGSPGSRSKTPPYGRTSQPARI